MGASDDTERTDLMTPSDTPNRFNHRTVIRVWVDGLPAPMHRAVVVTAAARNLPLALDARYKSDEETAFIGVVVPGRQMEAWRRFSPVLRETLAILRVPPEHIRVVKVEAHHGDIQSRPEPASWWVRRKRVRAWNRLTRSVTEDIMDYWRTTT